MVAKGSKRTKAIRERMARTGENWTTAARANDAEHAARTAVRDDTTTKDAAILAVFHEYDRTDD